MPGKPLNVACASILVLAAVGPPVAVVATFSQLSPIAPHILQWTASLPLLFGWQIHVILRSLAVVLGVALSSAVHFRRLSGTRFWVVWWVLFGLVLAALIASVPHKPIAAIAVLAGLGVALLYALRSLAFPDIDSAAWFKAVSVVHAFAAAGLILIWMSWLFGGRSQREEWTDWSEPIRDLVRNHVITWKAAFVSWSMPLAISVELAFIAVLSWARKRHAEFEQACQRQGMLSAKDALIVSTLKQLSLWLAAMLLLLWLHAAFNATGTRELNQTRENLADEVIGIGFWIFVGLALWTLDVLSVDDISHALSQSKVVQETKLYLESDWFRAILLVLAAIPLILCACIDALCRQFRDTGAHVHEPLLSFAMGWDWTSVIVKALWVGIVYIVCAVGFTQVTMLLLAQVNATFATWPVFTVSAIMFVIGFCIFMIPIAPGMPVYVVMGIVIMSSAVTHGWSYLSALVWATAVTFTMKLVFTAAAQKWIGEPLSDNLKVRRLVGIHTPYMRAIEVVLSEPGRIAAKVFLLVGGPDWPVAVLCGILRLPLMRVLLWISPVLLQSIVPCMIASLFMLKQRAPSDGHGQNLAEASLAIAAAVQAAFGLIAFICVQEVLEEDFDKLSNARPMDLPLVEMDKKEAARDREFWREVVWEHLSILTRTTLIISFFCMEASLLLLTFGDLLGLPCFREFGLQSSIADDLDGSVWRLVRPPGCVAFVLLIISSGGLCSFYCRPTISAVSEGEGLALA